MGREAEMGAQEKGGRDRGSRPPWDNVCDDSGGSLHLGGNLGDDRLELHEIEHFAGQDLLGHGIDLAGLLQFL